MIAALQRVGLSGYEAKAYLALLAAGVPLNGYAVAKRSGVPRSTVYETLAKLVARGAAFEVRDGDGVAGYLPLPSASLLSRLRHDLGTSLDDLEAALSQLVPAVSSHLVQSLHDVDSVVRRAEDVISGAREELQVSLCSPERPALQAALQRAAARQVRVSTVTSSSEEQPLRLLVVVADRCEVVIGGAAGDEVWGIWSDDPAVVLVAAGFLRQDLPLEVGP